MTEDDLGLRMIELHRQLTHYQMTGQNDKVAEICEERAKMWLSVSQPAKAADDLTFAADNWWFHGKHVWEEKKDKTEALAAFNCALTNLDKADRCDPSRVHQHWDARAKIEQSIKDLGTEPGKAKKYHLDYGIMRGNDRRTGDGGTIFDLASHEEALKTLDELKRNLSASGFRIVWYEIVEDD